MTTLAKIKPQPSSQSVAPSDVLLGKDVLELLSTSMYVDSMVMFREYVQNSADAIDVARERNLLGVDDVGSVEITIDPSQRTIRIRDNGAALDPAAFVKRMVALGGSEKRGTAARGFRGVGRLAGLAYAQELIFRSRAQGQSDISEARWDCRILKAALANQAFEGSVADLVSQVVSLRRVPATPSDPARFFEVELSKILRGRNDKLLNVDLVEAYLSQVAPIPFHVDFSFGSEITAHLSSFLKLSELEISINGAPSIRRPHRDSVSIGNKLSVCESVSLVEVPGQDGGLAAVGWFLHHGYEGALTVGTLVKGVRLRVGNLQVGESSILEDIFPEVRFNSWTVGELHVLDPKIIPNGRRDHFEYNAHFANLLNHLGPHARDIARRCRSSSARRSKIREFELAGEQVRSQIQVLQQGGIGRKARSESLASMEAHILKMESVVGHDLLSDVQPDEMHQELEQLRGQLKSVSNVATSGNPLDRLPAAERAFYERMFGLIYECSANRIAAKALVDRVIARAIIGKSPTK